MKNKNIIAPKNKLGHNKKPIQKIIASHIAKPDLIETLHYSKSKELFYIGERDMPEDSEFIMKGKRIDVVNKIIEIQNSWVNIYDLEFNQAQGGFHYNKGSHLPNTNGWFPIAKKQSDCKLNIFCNYMDEFYSSELGNKKLTLSIVMREWGKFEYLYNQLTQ